MLTKIAAERDEQDKAEGKMFKRYIGVTMDGRLKKNVNQVDGVLAMLQCYGMYKTIKREYFLIVDPRDGAIIEVFRGNNGSFPDIYKDDEIQANFGDFYFPISDKIRAEMEAHDRAE